MSREAYTPPSLSQGGQGASASGSGTGAFNITGQGSTFEDTSKPVHYLCGDCDNKVVLKKGDPIRCKECGYRVLYKERTNRSVFATDNFAAVPVWGADESQYDSVRGAMRGKR